MPRIRLTQGLFCLVLIVIFSLPLSHMVAAQGSTSLAGKNIYFSDEFDEADRFDRSPTGISRFAGMLRLMGANLYTLEWRRGIPENADLVVIAGPTAKISGDSDARLWNYIANGGKVLYILEAVNLKGRSVSVPGENADLFALTWVELGIQAYNQVAVVEGPVRTIEVVETDDNGEVISSNQVESPELSLEIWTDVVDSEHPITQDLELAATASDEDSAAAVTSGQLYFRGARPLQVDPGLQDFITALVFVNQQNVYGESDYNAYVNSGGVVNTTSARTALAAIWYWPPPSNTRKMVVAWSG